MANTDTHTAEHAKFSGALSRLAAGSNVLFVSGLVAILATLLIPLPTFVLDIGLACSIYWQSQC